MFYALIQRLSNGKFVAMRHEDETQLLRGRRSDALEGWMFLEHREGRSPARVLYALQGDRAIHGLGIHEVPDDILSQVYPPILIEMPQ